MPDSNVQHCRCEDISVSSTQKKVILDGTSTYKYEIRKSARGSRMLLATVKEHIKFSPIDIMNGAVEMRSWYGCSKSVLGLLPSTKPHVMHFYRQSLKYLNESKTPLEPARRSLARGSVQYEFGKKLLQTPLQLLKINNAEAQVPQELSPTELITSS